MFTSKSSDEIHLENAIIEYDYEYSHEYEARDRSTPENTSIEIYSVYIRNEATAWNNIDITDFVNEYCENLLEEIEGKIKEHYEENR